MTDSYERLSGLDNSFLALESHTTHMHVAGVALFDAAGLKDADGGIDIERVRRFVSSKLQLIPRYRQRLAMVPFERHPVWVDDEHFLLDYHVRHTSLPHPGSFDQLEALVGRLMSQQLDRRKPLWEMYIVEGIEDDRFAIVSKVHHCMIDGLAGVELLAVLLNFGPTEEIDDPKPFIPRPAPNGAELLVRETVRRAGRAASALRNIGAIGGHAQDLAFQTVRRVRAVANSLGSGWLSTASKTPLNGEIGPNRRFSTWTNELADVKAVKNTLGGTVNDVVLTTVAGGVRKFLIEHRNFDVEGSDFRVMAPVSVRSEDQQGEMGNQVAMWLTHMPIDEPDPLRRLEKVRAQTSLLKKTDQALGAATLVRVSTGAPATLVSLGTRLATVARPFNMTVTNVPGPQFPLYLLGSELLGQYPLVPLWESHGVGVALFSYNGKLFWGFNADYDVVEDLPVFEQCVADSFAELLAIANRMNARRSREADGWVADLAEPVAALVTVVREMVAEVLPDTTEQLNGKRLSFVRKSTVAGLSVKGDRVIIGFTNGAKLADPDGLLEGDGKRARHIALDPAAEAPMDALIALFAQLT